MRYWRDYRCSDCGAACRRRRSAVQSLVCVECGVARMRSQALANHTAKLLRDHQHAVRQLQRAQRTAA